MVQDTEYAIDLGSIYVRVNRQLTEDEQYKLAKGYLKQMMKQGNIEIVNIEKI